MQALERSVLSGTVTLESAGIKDRLLEVSGISGGARLERCVVLASHILTSGDLAKSEFLQFIDS